MLIKRKASAVIVFSILSFLCISLYTHTASGDSGSGTLSHENNEILEKIRGKHKNTHSIKATVYQDKNLSALKDPVHIVGTVILQKQGMLSWVTHVPEKSVTIIDNETITVYYPDDKEAEIHKLSDHLIARNTMTFFGSVMWGDMQDMEKRFSVDMYHDDGELLIELKPHSKMVSRYLSFILIRYNDQTGMPQGFHVMTPNGDRTVTRIENLTVNPELVDDTFKLTFPPDVRVRDYSETVDTN
jgi:outer membrane lipoprotein-sorting protein